MTIQRAALLTSLLVLGLGAAFVFYWRGDSAASTPVISAQQREDRKREILRIASIQDGNTRTAELRAYVGRNPQGPFLGVAYNLLLDSLYGTDKVAAMDLADRILERYTRPEEIEIRVPAYRLKLFVLAGANRPTEAADLARTVLLKESDPDLLRFASQFDPSNRETFENKIAEMEERDRVRAQRERLAELLGLPFADWESKSAPDKTRYLEGLVESLAQTAASDPQAAERLRSVLRLLADDLNNAGNGARALTFLDRFSSWVSQEGWFHAARGEASEASGDLEAALESYILAFAQEPRGATWSKVRGLTAKTGGAVPASVRRAAEAMVERSGTRTFASFSLKTPEGRSLSLADLSTRAVLVSFFFPG